VIEAQLAWMRDEHAADRSLRDDPWMHVATDGAVDIQKLVDIVLGASPRQVTDVVDLRIGIGGHGHVVAHRGEDPQPVGPQRRIRPD
jgi:hypothetical protein